MRIGEFQVTDSLARGKHSRTYRAAKGDQHVIIKTTDINSHEPHEHFKLRKEYDIGRLVCVGAEHIVQYLGIIPLACDSRKEKNCSHIAIVMEDFGGVELTKFIPRRGYPIAQFLDLAIQIVIGVGEIHDRNVIHFDIKPQNFVSRFLPLII
jgi:serine/threonine protein kinase